MSIVTNKQLTDRALSDGYAVPAFNVENLEYLQAVLRAAEEMRSPIIVAAAQVELDYMGGGVFVEMVKSLASELSVPVSIHLDHGPSFEAAVRAIRYGFTSVMYDGSALPLEENIAHTRRVVSAAHACGVSVEGEIGVIGGEEEAGDDPAAPDPESPVAPEGLAPPSAALADPEQCERFVAETGVDSFAAAIGNVHGFYRGEPNLQFDLLREIERRTQVPLVLHGGTGIPVEDIRKAISLGVSKINFGTGMRSSFIRTLRETLAANSDDADFMGILGEGREAMVTVAKDLIKMCMSDGKAEKSMVSAGRHV
jgi:ketose-bisphosphate aldolase